VGPAHKPHAHVLLGTTQGHAADLYEVHALLFSTAKQHLVRLRKVFHCAAGLGAALGHLVASIQHLPQPVAPRHPSDP
jgi:hypothetical protein